MNKREIQVNEFVGAPMTQICDGAGSGNAGLRHSYGQKFNLLTVKVNHIGSLDEVIPLRACSDYRKGKCQKGNKPADCIINITFESFHKLMGLRVGDKARILR